ncbi:MAG: FAD-dependent oxidoreductase [bacterium]
MRKLAIVGTGIAGLGCAHFLHSHFDLSLFEQNDYAGGHTHTLSAQEEGRTVFADSGFMVYNEVTYPNLTRLFRELDVPTQPTSMSFSVQHLPTGLEYCGSSFSQLFAQRKNLLNWRFIRLLRSIGRFNEEAEEALRNPRFENYTLQEFVEEKGYGKDFFDLYLSPMSSAVWSTPPDKMEEFPALTLLRFFHNHGFLGMYTQHPWRTVTGGAHTYVKKMAVTFLDRLNLNQKVQGIQREKGKVRVMCEGGKSEFFDHVILACHADQALKLLKDPTEEEKKLLSPFRYQKNPTIFHTDESVMPRNKRAWASWNYRIEEGASGETLPSTHYWMNSLQGVSDRANYFISLNDPGRVCPEKILKALEYEHPLFDRAAIEAQKTLPSLNQISDNQTTFFCGSYFKYGFHEDAFTSALELCRILLKKSIW